MSGRQPPLFVTMTTPAQNTPPTSCWRAEPWIPTRVASSGNFLMSVVFISLLRSVAADEAGAPTIAVFTRA
jgi:hypothetical protein